jgi:N-acetylmuramoyl-L-alanine amidase
MSPRLALTLLLPFLLASCGSVNPTVQAFQQRIPPAQGQPRVTPAQLLAEARVKVDLIQPGKAGRKYYRPMAPRYVTIHATENTSPGADAFRHALALKNGALTSGMRPGGNRIGFLTWHFTVQGSCAVQHLPTREQGEHADFNGPGNNTSIGIEMCENRGNDMAATVDRTARLAAYLMYAYHMPLQNVVPHYHWPRQGTSPLHKDCPHFLLDQHKPKASWKWFQSLVQQHYNRIVPGPLSGV